MSNANATSGWCTIGQRVEVLQTDEGLAGSRYAGRVLEMSKHRVHVEYEVGCVRKPKSCRTLIAPASLCVQAFLEEGSEDVLSCDWVKAELLRPFPPPTPEGFLQRLTHGDEVEILHEDGWWDVTFIGLRHSEGGVEYQVLVRYTLVCVSFGCMATELLLCSTIRVGAI